MGHVTISYSIKTLHMWYYIISYLTAIVAIRTPAMLALMDIPEDAEQPMGKVNISPLMQAVSTVV